MTDLLVLRSATVPLVVPLPRPVPLAVFDFDGTIVKPREGRPHPKDVEDWEFTRPSVPSVLQELGKTHRLVIVTDQSKPWKVDQIHAVMKAIGIDPSLVIAFTKELQKPSTVLFERLFASEDKETYKRDALYVGDAAGRPGDWSDCDRVFAERAGLRFQVPEQVFPLDRIHFNPLPPITGKEVLLFVGFPASGKSTFARALEGYHHVNGDEHKTPAAMRKEAAKHVATKSIVFDCTGATKKKRAEFIGFARDHGLPARTVVFPTSIERAMEQNKQRSLEGGVKVPDVAFYMFRKHYEPPTEDEGATVVFL
jgi:bifunctional polynucleotide phosphatase/kinase